MDVIDISSLPDVSDIEEDALNFNESGKGDSSDRACSHLLRVDRVIMIDIYGDDFGGSQAYVPRFGRKRKREYHSQPATRTEKIYWEIQFKRQRMFTTRREKTIERLKEKNKNLSDKIKQLRDLINRP